MSEVLNQDPKRSYLEQNQSVASSLFDKESIVHRRTSKFRIVSKQYYSETLYSLGGLFC